MGKRSVPANGRIAAYVAQRVRPHVLLSLSLAVAAAAWTGVGWSAFLGAEFVATLAQAFVLVFAFQVWDDVEDRHYDAAFFPDSVLANTNHVASFIVFAVAVGSAGLIPAVMISRLAEQLAIVNVAIVVLIAWYHRRGSDAPSLANAHAVAIKYPLLAWAIGPAFPRLVGLTALYLATSAFAILDDATLRSRPRARRVMTGEFALAAVLIAAHLLYGGRLW